MKRSVRFWYKRLWMLASLVIFSGVCFPGTHLNHIAAGSGTTLFFPEIWMSNGLQYFPYSPAPVLPIPIYPAVQWLYPCFPFTGCIVQQQYRKYEPRGKQRLQQSRRVFGQGTSLADESMKAWRAGLRPAVEPFRTDEHQIVPALRDHSLIRPEYREAGSVLPRFATGTE
ncbi:MAG: hypothetical protein IT527_04000 [Nitrosomonas sp.]|nr:hypothetical protein [Nitrosomonas sp.]